MVVDGSCSIDVRVVATRVVTFARGCEGGLGKKRRIAFSCGFLDAWMRRLGVRVRARGGASGGAGGFRLGGDAVRVFGVAARRRGECRRARGRIGKKSSSSDATSCHLERKFDGILSDTHLEIGLVFGRRRRSSTRRTPRRAPTLVVPRREGLPRTVRTRRLARGVEEASGTGR